MGRPVNSVVLTRGRLVEQPRLRYTQQGKACVDFTLAWDNGRRQEQRSDRDTSFIDCQMICGSVDGKANPAEYLANNGSKGDRVDILEGRLFTFNHQGQDGIKRKYTKVWVDNYELHPRQERQNAAVAVEEDLSDLDMEGLDI